MLEIASEVAGRVGELLLEQLTPPFLSVTSPLYWTHLASALLLALLVWVVADGGARAPSLSAFVERYLPARLVWHPSARADYLFYVANGVVFPLLIAPHLIGDAVVRDAIELWILEVLGPAAERGAPGAGATAAFTVLVFVAFDLGRWIGHRLMHRVPALWAFHKVHHSAEVLTPVTTFRVHPVELAVMALSTTLTTGLVAGTGAYLYPGASLWQTCSLGVAVALFAFDVSGSLLRHSGVWLSYGRFVERVLVSPAQHQIHHSSDPRHVGKNLGFALAVWDGIAGSLHVTGGREPLALGLGDGSERRYRSLLGLFSLPFADLFPGGAGTWASGRGAKSAGPRGSHASTTPC